MCANMDIKHLMILGKAGSGKSTIIKKVTEILRNQGKKVYLMAPTGKAALNIDGKTIHQALKIPSQISIAEKIISSRNYNNPEFEKADVLIVDEISLMTKQLYSLFMKAVNKLGKGKKLIFVGDFNQLPPVITSEQRIVYEKIEEQFANYSQYKKLDFLFMSEEFANDEWRIISLNKSYRQDQDDIFAEILDNTAEGKFDERINHLVSVEEFSERLIRKELLSENKTVFLASKNSIIDRINKICIKMLPGKEQIFEAEYNIYEEGYQPTE